MLFSAVDSWLERVSGGQIRRPHPGEKECLQCRVLGTGVFLAAGLHSALEATRARRGSSNRRFFGLVSGLFLFCATWRAITPTVPHHGHHADVSEMDVAGKTAETAESCENAQK
ncbi:Uncharacterized protein SCF082_LOCUS24503, partial [Durusdinium trenchii]